MSRTQTLSEVFSIVFSSIALALFGGVLSLWLSETPQYFFIFLLAFLTGCLCFAFWVTLLVYVLLTQKRKFSKYTRWLAIGSCLLNGLVAILNWAVVGLLCIPFLLNGSGS